MPGEQSWPTQPFPTNPPPHHAHVRRRRHQPVSPGGGSRALTTRLLAAKNHGLFTPLNHEDTVSVPTSNGGTLFGGAGAEPAHRRRLRRRARQPGHSAPAAPGRGLVAARRPVDRARSCISRTARCATASTGRGRTVCRARLRDRRSGEQHRRRCAALRRGGDSRGSRHRQGPHAVVPASQRGGRRQPGGFVGRRRRGRGGFRGAAAAVGSGAPPELIAGSGSAWTRPDAAGGTRTWRRAVSRRRPHYTRTRSTSTTPSATASSRRSRRS